MGSDLADQSRWERRRFSEFLEVKHGFAFLGEYFGDAGSHIVLTPGNFHDAGGFKAKDGKEKWYSGPVPKGYVLNQGAVVIAMTEQLEGLLGSSAIVPTDDLYLHNQRLGLVQIKDESVCDARFIYYLFNTKHVRQQISASATGTKIRHTSPTRIGQVEVLLPSIEEQRRIADILSALDDKIEVNRRMAATLEDMARATFRAWFVDFLPVRAKASARAEGRDPERAAMASLSGQDEADLDALPPETLASLATTAALFPDAWKGPLPTGWTEGTLDQLARMTTTSVQPSREPDAIFEHYSIPAYDEGNGPSMDRGDSIKSGKYVVHRDSVLVSKLNPNTPRVWMPDVKTDRAISSTEFMQFVPHDPKARAFLYLLMQSEEMQEQVLMRVTGSTGSRQRAQPAQIATLPVSVPPSSLIEAFCERFASQLELANRLQHERVVLARLRDTLLPHLLSGRYSDLSLDS